MKIGDRSIGEDFPPYIIAEMSNNHRGELDVAKSIIDAAAEAGADAVKIQTYDADSLTIDCDFDDFIIKDPLWAGKSYYQLYSEIAAPKSWTKELFSYAKNIGIQIFSSPFDLESIKLLEECGCPAYKVASFESQDPILLKSLAKTGKPLIISTGISSWADIVRTYHYLLESGQNPLAFLHCVSSYPSAEADANLKVLNRFKELPVLRGLSDHSLNNTAVLGSIPLGASIIEKHFTLSRKDGGPDAEFSLEPKEFREMAEQARMIWTALGAEDEIDRGVRKGSQHARSVYCVEDIKEGSLITEDNIRIIRPGFGLKPQYFNELIGKVASCDIGRGKAMKWEYVSE